MKLFGNQFPLPTFHAVQVHPSSIASANYALDFDGTNDYVDMGSPDLGINTTATYSA